MSVDQVKATIREGINAAEAAITILEQLRGDIAGTLDLARYTAHDSRHTHVVTGLARLAEARRELDTARRRLTGGIDAARDYLKILE